MVLWIPKDAGSASITFGNSRLLWKLKFRKFCILLCESLGNVQFRSNNNDFTVSNLGVIITNGVYVAEMQVIGI
jgi:hypothetical protein